MTMVWSLNLQRFLKQFTLVFDIHVHVLRTSNFPSNNVKWVHLHFYIKLALTPEDGHLLGVERM